MNEYLIALLWALIQITLCCSLSLGVAWKLRGRRPQVAAALLSGACVANVVLLMSAAFPQHQWSLHEAMSFLSVSEQAQLDTAEDANNMLAAAATQNHSNVASAANQPKGDVSLERGPTEALQSAARLPSVGWEWLNVRLLRFDSQIRQVSKSTGVQHRLGTVTLVTAAIMLGGFGIWLLGWFHARSIARHCTPIKNESIRSLSRSLQQQFGCQQHPRIFASPRVAVGATMGWRKPIILLSDKYESWQPEQLAAVLAHELAHAARRDYAWVLVSSLARVLLWFHPLVHLLVRRLRLEQELAADQIAASVLGAKAYGRALAQLALANQIPLRTPSPMLAASQICVIRRISMLKQGRLKPQFRQRRWVASLTLLAMAAAIPLSGLRGQTGEPQDDQTEITSTVTTEPTLDEEAAARREAQMAAMRKYPPLRAEGTMVYRQGKMVASPDTVNNAWLARFFQVATFGQTLPDDSVLYGDAAVEMRWRDLDKKQGSLQTEGTIRSVDNVLPGEVSKLLCAPALSHLEPMEKTQQVAGRTAQAYTARGSASGEPWCWVVDDEQGFHRGKTLEELEANMTREIVPPAIPALYQADYEAAVAAIVFDDCTGLKDEFVKFTEGSPKVEMQVIAPILEGLESLGVFLVDGGRDLKFRANFVDEDAASRVSLLLSGLIATVKSMDGLATDPVLQRVSEIQIQRAGRELSCSMNGEFYAQLASAEFTTPAAVDGWLAILSEGASAQEGVVELADTNWLLLLPSMLQQSVDAAPYRGRRLKLVADVNYSAGYEGCGGLAAWVNNSSNQAMTFASVAGDDASTIEDLFSEGHIQTTVPADLAYFYSGWRQTSIELDVPSDAANLSFGIYCKRGGLKVRELSIVDIGPARAGSQKCPSFLSAFNVPGRPILAQPTNLRFESTTDDKPEARVAEVGGNGEKK